MVRQHSRQSPSHKSQKRIIFLPILERKGEYNKKQGSSGTREGQVCSMKVANPTPATRFGVTQQKFSRHRATSMPPMRNAVTLVVLEHVRTCKFPFPAVCFDVKKPPKIPAIITVRFESGLVRLAKRYASQPHAAAPATPGGKRRNRAKRPHPPQDPQYAALAREIEGFGPGGWHLWTPAPSPWSSLSSTRGL